MRYSFNTIYSLSLAALVGLLVACNASQKASKDLSVQVAEAYFLAALAKDYDGLKKILAEDVQFYGPKLQDTLDKVALIKSWRKLHQRFDRVEACKVSVFKAASTKLSRKLKSDLENDWVFYYYEAHFHDPQKNRWIDFRVHVKMLIGQRQIKQLYIYVNQADILEQMKQPISVE
ncbi:hypothetical protein BKI52_08105 [marine bacterium AO1-C]|nr:hypothetical protein BKI52_08105 [marine bacterium AO1-C]